MIEERTEALRRIIERELPAKAPPRNTAPRATVDAEITQDDETLLKIAFGSKNGASIERLFHGDVSDYAGDQSAADLALCAHLAFYTGRDSGRMDRLFRRSGLYRPKWDERHATDGSTYGTLTIDFANRNCTNVYTPTRRQRRENRERQQHEQRRHEHERGEEDRSGGQRDEGVSSEPTSFSTLADLPDDPKRAERLGLETLAVYPDAHSAALFLCSRWRPRLRVIPSQSGPQRQWLLYERGSWELIGVDQIASLMISSLLKNAVPALADVETRTARDAVDYVVDVARSKKILGVVDRLALVPSMQLPSDAIGSHFDRDPYLVNVQNGTIDLRTGKLRSHEPDDWCAKMAPVKYDPNAAAPLWEKLIDEFCVGDRELVAYLQAALGYAMTGLTAAQVLFVLFGQGANGKSTLVEIVQSILGTAASGYAGTIRSEVLLKSLHGTDRHPTEIADLVGKRFVAVHELGGVDAKFNASLVKALTGSDLISARRIRENAFQFSPTHTFFCLANTPPRSDDATEAMLRRIVLIPARATFALQSDQAAKVLGTDGKRFVRKDHVAQAIVARERAGVFAWLVHGARQFLKDGLPSSKAIAAASERYRERVDHLKMFLNEECVFPKTAFSHIGVLFNAYASWCNDHEIDGPERMFSPDKLGSRLLDLGYRRDKVDHVRGYWGLRLAEKAGAGDDDAA